LSMERSGQKVSMGMVDIRILVNIQMPERPLHLHDKNHSINNILYLYLYITKHCEYSPPNHSK
jgi:hypothetical protein